MMDAKDFYLLVGKTDFCERYYALCKRYASKSVLRPSSKKRDVLNILKDLGQPSVWNAVDRSYSCDCILKVGKLFMGFAIEGKESVEFGFCLYADESRIGSNFAVIAHSAASTTGKLVPHPPYPRPIFNNLGELKSILAELFSLADLLVAVIESLNV